MRIIYREDQEQREHVSLSGEAAFADESEGRARSRFAACPTRRRWSLRLKAITSARA